MIYVYVICEGHTEEEFINAILYPHFTSRQVYLKPRIIGKSGKRGGNVSYNRFLNDVRRLLNHKDSYCTTLIDFYGLDGNFPGYRQAKQLSGSKERSRSIVDSLNVELKDKLSWEEQKRFIPYFQMHEFEGLLFSDACILANKLQIDSKNIESILAGFGNNPEEINCRPDTSPSHRIIRLKKVKKERYEKTIYGPIIAKEIGLTGMRQRCPIFDAWISELEQLAPVT